MPKRLATLIGLALIPLSGCELDHLSSGHPDQEGKQCSEIQQQYEGRPDILSVTSDWNHIVRICTIRVVAKSTKDASSIRLSEQQGLGVPEFASKLGVAQTRDEVIIRYRIRE